MHTVSTLFFFVLLFFQGFTQDKLSKKEQRLYSELYSIAIDSFVAKKPSHIVLIDSTDNRQIQEAIFLDYVNHLRSITSREIDSSWYSFLEVVDEKKARLPKIKVSQTRSIHVIRLMNRDTLFKIQQKNHFVGRGIVEPFGWVDGYVTLSTPIISRKRDKAIIEISYTRDDLDGNGGIFLLEKKKDRWIIVKYMRMWAA